MSGKKRDLAAEDDQLWTLVARSTTPLSQQQRNWHIGVKQALSESVAPEQKSPPVIRKMLSTKSHDAAPTTIPPPAGAVSHPIDDTTAKKLAKGRQKIDARIDLHGMTQDRARSTLLDFVSLAKAADHRIVLVITGKGNMGTGILKQRVPDWLSVPPFSELVNGYRISHVSHGGEGALYVRLRRNRTRQ